MTATMPTKDQSIDRLVRLFDGTRLRDTSVTGRDASSEALSDKGRIVMSKCFRRLQVKAQVYSLEHNAAVRSRLTHTLEVATMGEIIATRVVQTLGKRFSPAAAAFVSTVENACLLHDVGNPPYGHLGEYAIANWFRMNHDRTARRWSNHGVTKADVDLYLSALTHFDGNPQGFRTVTRLSWLNDEYGLNLTQSLLASLVKYLGCQTGEGHLRKKVGYFPTEQGIIERLWKNLGLETRKDGAPAARHPVCFLMEAADDLCYCLSDIDDSIEKGVVQEEHFLSQVRASKCLFLTRILSAATETAERSRYPSCDATFANFKVQTGREIGDRLANVFCENLPKIVAGAVDSPLIDLDSEIQQATRVLRGYTKAHVFRSKEAVTVELGGFRILSRLLDHFSLLLFAGTREFDRIIADAKPAMAPPPNAASNHSPQLRPGELPLQVRLATLLPRKQMQAYYFGRDGCQALEPVYRAHLIVDFIAGMTDTHAVKVFNVLEGLSPGEVLR